MFQNKCVYFNYKDNLLFINRQNMPTKLGINNKMFCFVQMLGFYYL
jgi:hypothetical protein